MDTSTTTIAQPVKARSLKNTSNKRLLQYSNPRVNPTTASKSPSNADASTGATPSTVAASHQPSAYQNAGVAGQQNVQSILAEGGICESQRRASSYGLGLLARLRNDMFTVWQCADFLSSMLCSAYGYIAIGIDLSLIIIKYTKKEASNVEYMFGCLHMSPTVVLFDVEARRIYIRHCEVLYSATLNDLGRSDDNA
ncbi:hypothetical protein Tco_0500183 [Tanacetum coccineum]